MPRNDQAVRQLVILKKLETSRYGLTIQQLTEALDSAGIRHPRTLRRDLAAIEAAGYPLLTERVDGRVRWKFIDGARSTSRCDSRPRNSWPSPSAAGSSPRSKAPHCIPPCNRPSEKPPLFCRRKDCVPRASGDEPVYWSMLRTFQTVLPAGVGMNRYDLTARMCPSKIRSAFNAHPVR